MNVRFFCFAPLIALALALPLHVYAASCPILVNIPVQSVINADSSVPIGGVLVEQKVTFPGGPAICNNYPSIGYDVLTYSNDSLPYMGSYQYQLSTGIVVKTLISRGFFYPAYVPTTGCLKPDNCSTTGPDYGTSGQSWVGGTATITYIKSDKIPSNTVIPAGTEIYSLGVGYGEYPQFKFVTGNPMNIKTDTTSFTCSINNGSPLNVDMGLLEKDKIGDFAGGYGAIEKTININCESENISMINDVTARMNFTPAAVSSGAMMITSNSGLGIISTLNGITMTNQTTVPLKLLVGLNTLRMEFTPAQAVALIETGGFNASATLLISWQ